MAYLAIRGSGAVNGVSRLHGKVSRHIFEPLFPHWPEDEVPVGHVTNGVHMPSWDSKAADDLWMEACGKDRWLGTTENLEQDIRRVSDAGPLAISHRRQQVVSLNTLASDCPGNLPPPARPPRRLTMRSICLIPMR